MLAAGTTWASPEMMQIVGFRWDGIQLTLATAGSGTSIGNGLVLTNKHVVMLNDGTEADFVLLCPAHPTKPTRSVACSIPAGVVATHPDHDAALVRSLDDRYLPAVGVVHTEPQKGDYVRIEGFPVVTEEFTNFGDHRTIDEMRRWLKEGGEIREAGDRLTITRGKIFAKGNMSKDQSRMYATDAVVNFGNSGGAAFDRAGFFIGIPTLRNKEFQSYVLDVVQLLPWIAENQNAQPDVSVEIQRFVKNLINKKQDEIPVAEGTQESTLPSLTSRRRTKTRSVRAVPTRTTSRRTTTTRNWSSPYASRSRR